MFGKKPRIVTALGNARSTNVLIGEESKLLESVRTGLTGAEYGKWKTWYRGDWLTGTYRTRQLVQVFSDFLQDPMTHLTPPVLWDGWEAYYHIMHYEGDRSADAQ